MNEEKTKNMDSRCWLAAKRWDEFVEPIRKKYGIEALRSENVDKKKKKMI